MQGSFCSPCWPRSPVRQRLARSPPDDARACLGRDAVASYDLALILLEMATDSSADTEAAALLASSCELGHAAACRQLGRAFEGGRGVERERGAALSLCETACCLGESACDKVERMSAPPTVESSAISRRRVLDFRAS